MSRVGHIFLSAFLNIFSASFKDFFRLGGAFFFFFSMSPSLPYISFFRSSFSRLLAPMTLSNMFVALSFSRGPSILKVMLYQPFLGSRRTLRFRSRP